MQWLAWPVNFATHPYSKPEATSSSLHPGAWTATAAQPDALGAELTAALRVARVVDVGPHP
jgi:hypothetical protein